MELYEQIRREYEHGAGTVRGVSRKLGVPRREVRQALASAVPMDRKVPERERPRLSAAVPFIDEILETDRKAPRKQRHTAHRIWMRLRRELPAVEVAESTVRISGKRPRGSSLPAAECFVLSTRTTVRRFVEQHLRRSAPPLSCPLLFLLAASRGCG